MSDNLKQLFELHPIVMSYISNDIHCSAFQKMALILQCDWDCFSSLTIYFETPLCPDIHSKEALMEILEVSPGS